MYKDFQGGREVDWALAQYRWIVSWVVVLRTGRHTWEVEIPNEVVSLAELFRMGTSTEEGMNGSVVMK